MAIAAIKGAEREGRLKPGDSVQRVRAVAGAGIGRPVRAKPEDLVAPGETRSRPGRRGRPWTLVEVGRVEILALDFGIELAPGETRREHGDPRDPVELAGRATLPRRR